jgi:hypothetical protein
VPGRVGQGTGCAPPWLRNRIVVVVVIRAGAGARGVLGPRRPRIARAAAGPPGAGPGGVGARGARPGSGACASGRNNAGGTGGGIPGVLRPDRNGNSRPQKIQHSGFMQKSRSAQQAAGSRQQQLRPPPSLVGIGQDLVKRPPAAAVTRAASCICLQIRSDRACTRFSLSLSLSLSLSHLRSLRNCGGGAVGQQPGSCLCQSESDSCLLQGALGPFATTQLYSCRNSYGNTVRPNSCRILRCTILQLKQAAESKGQKRLAMRRLKPNRTTDHHKGPMLTHMLSHAHFFTCTQR